MLYLRVSRVAAAATLQTGKTLHIHSTMISVLNVVQISQYMKHSIDNLSAFQYKLKLVIAGMSDNPSNSLPVDKKYDILNVYYRQWSASFADDLKRHESAYSLDGEHRWQFVLTGGVLAQRKNDNAIEFTQLPSRTRGIASRTWAVLLPTELQKFAMDPQQDLLVVLEAPLVDDE